MKHWRVWVGLAWVAIGTAAAGAASPPLRVGMVGLEHGHAAGFLGGGALTPAGGLLHRADAELVGVVEPDRAIFDAYAKAFHLPADLRFDTVEQMVAARHPTAALVFTAPDVHRKVVEDCAKLGVHVMMEKPLAFRYADAVAIRKAAGAGHVHVLVDFETTWYPANAAAIAILRSGAVGPVVKAVFRDGHPGPAKIGVQPEFLAWLTDPVRGGDGALVDFGCYGPSLMTGLMGGQPPTSVTAVTARLQPDRYPKVDDEAEIVLSYPSAVAIVQGSWNWPVPYKQMDLYGRTGYAKVIDGGQLEVRRPRGGRSTTRPAALASPDDDPLHYLAAVIDGSATEGDGPSSLKTNVTVTEILDAAEQSARTGRGVAAVARRRVSVRRGAVHHDGCRHRRSSASRPSPRSQRSNRSEFGSETRQAVHDVCPARRRRTIGDMAAHTRVICDRCGRAIPRHAHYRVRIDVVADPSPPEITQEDVEEADYDWTVAQLLDEMKNATADELEEAVAKSFEFRICRACQVRLIRNPLGRTTDTGSGTN